MMKKAGRNTYLIPMLVSLGLLFAFLCRFIIQEYEDELSFVEVSAKETAYLDVLDEIEKYIGTREKVPAELRELPSELIAFDSVWHEQRDMEFNLSFIKDSFDQELKRIMVFDAQGNANDILDLETTQVSKFQIIKAILPQIIFAFILFGSVLFTFWMILRHLKRERMHTELRNNLISNMSHELKTPVTTIGVAIEAIQKFSDSTDVAKRNNYLDISKQQVDRLNLLIDKTLKMSLFQAGAFKLEKQAIDLKQEIERVRQSVQLQLNQQQATVQWNYEGTNFQYYGDQTHLISVIYNLLENALKYTKTTPKIALKLEERQGDYRLTIADNGIGVPPAYRQKIFDKLFRVPTGDVHNVKGHGLGLSYVREVIQAHQGQIRAIDSPLGGICIEIILPKTKERR